MSGMDDNTVLFDELSEFLDQYINGTDPFDVTSAFSDPWDGRLSIVFPGFAGLGITETRLTLQTQASPTIFSDGFESGDTAAWTDTIP